MIIMDYNGKNNKDKKGKSLLLSSIPIAVALAAMIALAPSLSQQQSVLAQNNTTNQPATTGMSLPPLTASQALPDSVFKLSRANIPIDIPLSKGYVNGNEVFFITTDASDQKIAFQLTVYADL
jgi:hypothetical protein